HHPLHIEVSLAERIRTDSVWVSKASEAANGTHAVCVRCVRARRNSGIGGSLIGFARRVLGAKGCNLQRLGRSYRRVPYLGVVTSQTSGSRGRAERRALPPGRATASASRRRARSSPPRAAAW